MSERNCDDCVLWNCDNCVFATRSGGCRSWDCEFMPIREAGRREMNKTTKKIALIGILTAAYVVLSLSLKIPLGIGNIQLDLGYIALTVACLTCGAYAAIVGGLGALIESAYFSAYGISWGWIAMNVIIGVVCGVLLRNVYNYNGRQFFARFGIIVAAVFLGVAAKTVIECSLYGIPYPVKIPKSFVAFIVDTIVMVIGLPIATRVAKETAPTIR